MLDGFAVSYTAPDLYGNIDGAGDRGHDLAVDRPAREGPVEVNDMDELGAFILKLDRLFYRVVSIHGLPAGIPLDEADTLAVAYVYRRYHDHLSHLSGGRYSGPPLELQGTYSIIHSADEIPDDFQAGIVAFFGMELGRDQVVFPDDAGKIDPV